MSLISLPRKEHLKKILKIGFPIVKEYKKAEVFACNSFWILYCFGYTI